MTTAILITVREGNPVHTFCSRKEAKNGLRAAIEADTMASAFYLSADAAACFQSSQEIRDVVEAEKGKLMRVLPVINAMRKCGKRLTAVITRD